MLRNGGKISVMDWSNPGRSSRDGARPRVRIPTIEFVEKLPEQGIKRLSAERANRDDIQRGWAREVMASRRFISYPVSLASGTLLPAWRSTSIVGGS